MNYVDVLKDLESGKVRAVQFIDGKCVANKFVKEKILEAFKNGELTKFGEFIDKHTLPPRTFELANKVRLVPGGSSVRTGAYLAEGVIMMPPSYVNVGAFVDTGTMIDSHVLVGSCAQIGKNVHLSTGVQIGGVLEPIGETPVIINDGAFIGADAVIVEGVQVGTKAVIAPGVILTKSTPLFDLVNERVLDLSREAVPANAVVVSGSRSISKSDFAKSNGLSLYVPVIVKYRDESTDSKLVLEDLLR